MHGTEIRDRCVPWDFLYRALDPLIGFLNGGRKTRTARGADYKRYNFNYYFDIGRIRSGALTPYNSLSEVSHELIACRCCPTAEDLSAAARLCCPGAFVARHASGRAPSGRVAPSARSSGCMARETKAALPLATAGLNVGSHPLVIRARSAARCVRQWIFIRLL